jgi:parvulin-like peptidyl-prolyl isomerase
VATRRHSSSLSIACQLLPLALAACSDPPDTSPLGLEFTALAAKPEQATQVKVQHVLVAFVGAKRGSESKRDYKQAVALTTELLAKARAGEDFAAMVPKYSGDDGSGIYALDVRNRGEFAEHFTTAAFRLAVGEVGVAPFHRSKSPFGFHLIKRLQ